LNLTIAQFSVIIGGGAARSVYGRARYVRSSAQASIEFIVVSNKLYAHLLQANVVFFVAFVLQVLTFGCATLGI
jgi:hypothetical protein